MNWFRKIKIKKDIYKWEKNGKPVPPPHIIKQRVLKFYAKEFNLEIFVETGTYYGFMIDALKDNFNYIYSIELSEKLFHLANKKFDKYEHIKLINGDSASELNNVVKKINKPVLFWLDGHYSAGITARGIKDTPIIEELDSIFQHSDKNSVIIIDDARCFDADSEYPSIQYLKEFIKEKNPLVDIVVKNDMIRVTPRTIRAEI